MKTLCPLTEKASGLRAGEGFGIGNNPEFLREGSALADFFAPPMILIGAEDDETARKISALYKGIDAPRELCAPEIAESVKYVSNAWRASKVAFANEMGNILHAHGIDSHAAMNIFFNDTKINLGKSFLMPGFAFGGSCLPKDMRALRASANDRGLATPLFDSVLEANEAQIRRGFELIRGTGRRNAALLGLSFKIGTDDLRESPLVTLAEMLLENGFGLKIYDPAARGTVASCKRLLPHYIQDAAQLADSDVLIVGNAAPEFLRIVADLPDSVPVVDLVRLGGAEKRGSYTGICW
jgi:GDP-mannose 6-dehydrogenase